MTSTTTVTVLFTDVVGNTALRQRIGDAAAAAARPLLEEARELYAYMDRQDDVEAVDALLEEKAAGRSGRFVAREQDG